MKKKAKKGKTVLPDSSSASESPMKQVVFDLTVFSSGEDEVITLRAKTPPPESDTDEAGEFDSDESHF